MEHDVPVAFRCARSQSAVLVLWLVARRSGVIVGRGEVNRAPYRVWQAQKKSAPEDSLRR
ncbi:hypothetical protein [Paraburkholderia sp. J12]|uniref:hypothetical protein n=1 Tax=Paraburkholderia sp. J12 TaxID=2805432 RepID=UPI002ABE66B7|nr:hypothetical protein [Paraburkholderia sp. J12]